MRGRTNRRPAPWRVACFAVLLAICGAWVSFSDLFAPVTGKSVSVQIPDFCGAEWQTLQTADWIETEIEFRHDASVPGGVILSQSPSAGSRRKLTAQSPRCRVRLVVSLGEQTERLPEVIGLDFREAEALLRARGFAVEIQKAEGAYPEGSVFAVSPREGSELPFGARVTLSVSAGTPTESVRVPAVCGLSRADALVQIWLSRLTVGEVIDVEADGEEGCVIPPQHFP